MNRQVHVYLPDELAIRLKIYAVQQSTSASAVVAEAIELYLNAKENQPETPAPVVVAKRRSKKEVAA